MKNKYIYFFLFLFIILSIFFQNTHFNSFYSYAKTLKKPVYHIVKKGEYLELIAKKYNTTVSKLKKLNNIKSDIIYPGQKLIVKYIYIKSKKSPKNIKTSQNLIKKPIYHIVKRNEYLGLIAKKYHTTVSRLKKLNNLKSNIIYPGKKLIVGYVTTKSSAFKEVQKSKKREVVFYLTKKPIYHKVKKGEYLGLIAKKYRTYISTIKRLNNLRSDIIYPGQRLLIGYRTVKVQAFQEERQPSPDIKEIITYHIVKKGETLKSIARKYNASIEILKKLNNLKSFKIYPGQKIIISKKIIFLNQKGIVENIQNKIRQDVSEETAPLFKIIKKPIYHIVKRNEYLGLIAKKYHTTVSRLKKLNNLKSNIIYPGQKLIVGYEVIPVLVSDKNEKEKKTSPQDTDAERLFYKLETKYQKFITHRSKTRRDWLNIIGEYRRLYLLYPGSNIAPRAMLRTANLYYKLYQISKKEEDLEEALRRYEMVIENYSFTPQAEEAYFWLITIYKKELKNKEKAKKLLVEFENKYPKSRWLTKLGSFTKPTNKSLSSQVKVLKIKPISGEDYTRVIINVSKDFEYKTDILKGTQEKPPRIYVDIYPAKLGKDLPKKIYIRNSHLQKIRIAQFNKNTVRVVLDLSSLTSYKIFKITEPPQLILDLEGVTKHETKKSKTLKNQNYINLARQFGLGIKRIVIDPGHGGGDPGAIAFNGIKEKDVVLKIAKELKKILENSLGIEVILTRERDVFIPLMQRAAIANSKKADLFISLHLNSSPDHSARGIETYYLNFTTDPEAMRVAALENAASDQSLSDLQDLIRAILANTKLSESRLLAEKVQSQLVKHLSRYYSYIEDRGVKCAPFLVLVGTRMPAILVEVSFISNPLEARRLKSSLYLKRIAEGIAKGIKVYMQTLKLYKPAS
ncbi:hypothetical protein DRN73_03900 [Candidatus Pacearchaeota archaeon]|nr:MAG: hypothetical protein DRN73_03900 [Candidatus Pacearchaeota archaeon]